MRGRKENRKEEKENEKIESKRDTHNWCCFQHREKIFPINYHSKPASATGRIYWSVYSVSHCWFRNQMKVCCCFQHKLKWICKALLFSSVSYRKEWLLGHNTKNAVLLCIWKHFIFYPKTYLRINLCWIMMIFNGCIFKDTNDGDKIG